MPNPDMITQYLASRGAAPSADNANRVRQHFAANPDLLDRRAMGLPGGLDDNSAVLDAILSKHITESMPQVPQGSVETGPVEQIPPPSKTGATVKGPGEVGGTKAGVASRQGNYGPGASPSRQGGYSAPSADTMGTNMVAGMDVANQAGSGLSNWLIGLLTGGAGLYGLSKMAGGGAQAAPTGPLPGSVPATATPDNTSQDAMKARMQAEIDAENDAMARKMMEEQSTRTKQKNTEDLARAARRATGRR